MADLERIFSRRRSVRKYRNGHISRELLEEAVWAAAQAPTARNVQPWEFVVVTQKSRLKELALLVSPNGAFVEQAAACIIIFCMDTKYYLEDGCAATTQALLALSLSGLGACWIAGDKKDYAEKVKTFAGAPSEMKLVSLVSVGESDEKPQPLKREISTLIHWDRF
ncbi:MAG: nitroreductase family protein [Candidatus Omnitrophica bacterium]|nr:nitroreductase family protein [Candidatus Omnitrophota bacterium]MDD5574463.1 nitroreductase family protein [Candidatus Omnitrophota bacterium]